MSSDDNVSARELLAMSRYPAPTEDELRASLRAALARGYCTPANSNKELDAVLIDAMVDELIAADA